MTAGVGGKSRSRIRQYPPMVTRAKSAEEKRREKRERVTLSTLPALALQNIAGCLDTDDFIAFRQSCSSIRNAVMDVHLESPLRMQFLSLRVQSRGGKNCIAVAISEEPEVSPAQEALRAIRRYQTEDDPVFPLESPPEIVFSHSEFIFQLDDALKTIRFLHQIYSFSGVYLTDTYMMPEVLTELATVTRRGKAVPSLFKYTETALPTARIPEDSHDIDGLALEAFLEELAPKKLEIVCSRSYRPYGPSPSLPHWVALRTASELVVKVPPLSGALFNDAVVEQFTARSIKLLFVSSCTPATISRVLRQHNSWQGSAIEKIYLQMPSAVGLLCRSYQVKAAVKAADDSVCIEHKLQQAWEAEVRLKGDEKTRIQIETHFLGQGSSICVELSLVTLKPGEKWGQKTKAIRP